MPVRSLRAKRRIAVSWATALTIGVLAIVFGGSGIGKVLSPGPVTLQHSQVADCGGCHRAFDKGPLSWVHAAMGGRDPVAESQRCLNCHGREDAPFAAHSVDAKALASASADGGKDLETEGTPTDVKLTRLLFETPIAATDSFACGTCHKEHRGGGADLNVMSDGQCHSCHSKTFASFADGHPDFAPYPYVRRTRLNFDHRSHIERHFIKAGPEKAPETCTNCHMPSDSGEFMLVRNFDETCAACHLPQIEGEGLTGAKGIVFLTVPGLDLEVLREGGVEIGEWPELSEEAITPFVKMLLAGRPELEPDLQRVESLDLLDLTDATATDLAAVGNVAWAVKTLIHDALFDGLAPVGKTITSTLGQDVDAAKLSDLLGAVPLDVVRSAQDAWFPNLFREVAQGRDGLAAAVTVETAPGDVSAATGDVAALDDEMAASQDDEILSDDEEILSEDDDEILSDEDDEILSEDDQEILADEDEGILSDDDSILSDEEGLSDDDDALADDEILSDEESGIADSGPTDDTVGSDISALVKDLSELDVEAWAELGGWYRLDFALYFRPTGHRDAFLRTWLDLSGRAIETSKASVGSTLFAALSHKATPGRCTKCHSVDRSETGGSSVNWMPKGDQPDYWHPTFFSHTTHFSMLDQEGCNTCHKFNRDAKYAAAFEQPDPAIFASNFLPLDKSVCAACHVEAEAGESCLGCHRYHIGRFPGPVVETLMYGEGSALESGSGAGN